MNASERPPRFNIVAIRLHGARQDDLCLAETALFPKVVGLHEKIGYCDHGATRRIWGVRSVRLGRRSGWYPAQLVELVPRIVELTACFGELLVEII